jgi:hypothetical protein
MMPTYPWAFWHQFIVAMGEVYSQLAICYATIHLLQQTLLPAAANANGTEEIIRRFNQKWKYWIVNYLGMYRFQDPGNSHITKQLPYYPSARSIREESYCYYRLLSDYIFACIPYIRLSNALKDDKRNASFSINLLVDHYYSICYQV